LFLLVEVNYLEACFDVLPGVWVQVLWVLVATD